MSQPIVEPYPGFVQPSPPEVPDKEPWNGISTAGRLGPCAPADAGTTSAPDTVLEGHALLGIYLPGKHSRRIALIQSLETAVACCDRLRTALWDTFQTCVAEFSNARVYRA